MASTKKRHHPSDNRVILLLDLDCFYAQCECIRLGFDSTNTKLALLQWNSVLAVTYPARQDQVQRGDSWPIVAAKSKDCYCVHVPVLETQAQDHNQGENQHHDHDDEDHLHVDDHHNGDRDNLIRNQDLALEYKKCFQLSHQQQQDARINDIGTRKFSTQGKASIERYRIASARIFSIVHQQLPPNVVLERASIDEFFLDVTDACYEQVTTTTTTTTTTTNNNNNNNNNKSRQKHQSEQLELTQALQATKVIGQDANQNHPSLQTKDGNENECQNTYIQALQYGCLWAHRIRSHIRRELGFTLSAGISINKTLAKLAASYNKPNGQAIAYPGEGVDYVLNHTSIRKCRNLGGKLGKKICTLLESSDIPLTVANIQKHLALSQLQQELGNLETAKWVLNISKGVDYDRVLSKNTTAITKSITAFKSLPYTANGFLVEEIQHWIRLLAKEIVSRVECDTQRNHRYPKTINLQYYSSGNAIKRDHHSHKSVRTSFPSERLSPREKVEQLVKITIQLLQSKEGKMYRLDRIGLCATDFVNRQSHTILNFFAKSDKNNMNITGRTYMASSGNTANALPAITSSSKDAVKALPMTHGKEEALNFRPLAQTTQKLMPELIHDYKTKNLDTARTSSFSSENGYAALWAQDYGDEDLALARKLQAQFDRENRVLEAIDKRKRTQGNMTGKTPTFAKSEKKTKTRRIDSYFVKSHVDK